MNSKTSDVPKNKPSDWSLANLNFLFLITTGYIIGEISHFLIGVTSKAGSVTSKEETRPEILFSFLSIFSAN